MDRRTVKLVHRWPAQLIFLFLCARVSAQDNVAPEFANYPFLLRLEQTTEDSKVCVLLHRNGEFHLEHTRSDETSVSEGKLPEADFLKLKQALDNDELQKISQPQIVPPLLYSMNDQLQVNVFRTDHWQNLLFPDSSSQIPFRQPLKPLVAWLSALHNEPHRELSEDEGKNNCLTPGKIRLKIRTKDSIPALAGAKSNENAPSSAASEGVKPRPRYPNLFLMRYSRDHFSTGTLERTCVIVNPAGHFRMEKGSQQISYKMKESVFEGAVPENELRELRQILDAPELKNERHQNLLEGLVVHDAEVTSLSVPREKEIQKLVFSSYFGSPSGSKQASSSDDDTSPIEPIRKWLKTSIESQKLKPLKSALPNNCAPLP